MYASIQGQVFNFDNIRIIEKHTIKGKFWITFFLVPESTESFSYKTEQDRDIAYNKLLELLDVQVLENHIAADKVETEHCIHCGNAL